MAEAMPFRQHYLERLNIRSRGVENWVLIERRTLWRRAGITFLGAMAFLAAGLYFVNQCENGNCTDVNELSAIGTIAVAIAIALGLVLFILPAVLARFMHAHRRAEWEIQFGPRLDELEAQFANRIDAPAETRAIRDLLEQTLAGDFVGERIAVRANFWSGLGRLLWIGAVAIFVVGVLSGDGEAAMVMGVFAAPAFVLGLVCRSLGKKCHALATKGTEKHVAAVEEALSKKLDLPAPSFSVYTRGGPANQPNATP